MKDLAANSRSVILISTVTLTYAFAPGVMGQVSLQVADALEQPFPDGQFDLVWSMESGEHMPDKSKVTFFY